jgi:hypothetical protein
MAGYAGLGAGCDYAVSMRCFNTGRRALTRATAGTYRRLAMSRID